MQLINDVKYIWRRNFKWTERLSFSLVLLGVLIIYYYSRYVKTGVSFNEYQTEVYVLVSILTSFVIVDFWGHFILRIWLTVAGFTGKIMNLIIFSILYFVILTPISIFKNIFSKKKKSLQTNWALKMYINSDHLKMG